MISPSLGQAAFRWAVFIVVLSGLSLLLAPPGTPQFVISVFMLIVGLLFAAVIFVLVRIKSR